jgi:hypothetical protein
LKGRSTSMAVLIAASNKQRCCPRYTLGTRAFACAGAYRYRYCIRDRSSPVLRQVTSYVTDAPIQGDAKTCKFVPHDAVVSSCTLSPLTSNVTSSSRLSRVVPIHHEWCSPNLVYIPDQQCLLFRPVAPSHDDPCDFAH